MRLSIRWKLLILLLAIALIPLGIVTWTGQRSARRLGTDFAEQTGGMMAEAAEHQLLTIVDHAARTMFRERQLVELALTMQALEVDARLAHQPRATAQVYFDTDFDGKVSAPLQMRPSLRHSTLTPEGRRQPVMISHATQVMRVAPGVDRATVTTDIARLATLTDVYRSLHNRYPELIYWQYTALDSGVHTSFPGKGGYPPDFDPRSRIWYTRAREADALTWVPPSRDATTGNVMLTCATPVHRADGGFAGVTAIDVSLGELLRKVGLPRQWQRHAMAMFVRVDASLATDAPLVLVDQDDDDDPDRDWSQTLRTRPLEADDVKQTQAILADMTAGHHNVREITRSGKAWLCGYGPVSDIGGYFMVMVPRAEIVAMATRIEQQMLGRTWRQLHLTGLIALGVVVLTVAVGLLASRHFTRPVKQLATAANDIAAGQLDTRVRIRTGDELAVLGKAFNAMVPKLRDLLQVRQSLTLAMEVQQSLLPSEPPIVPGLDIAGHSIYCDETGGDYYDFLAVEELGPNRVVVAVGDVTGHGIAAALLMATARALLRSQAGSPSLAGVMTKVNRHLNIERLPGKFMTLYCCVLDTAAQRVVWTSAGHDPAIVYHPDRDTFTEWTGEDLPLGIDPAWTYHEASLEGWHSGDVVVIGTDGIWECRNHAMEQFGKDRLREVIRANAGKSAAEISGAITDTVHTYRGAKPQEDDITLVVLKMV